MKGSFLATLIKYGLGLGLLGWVVGKNWDPTPAKPELLLLGGGGLSESFTNPGLRNVLEQPINWTVLIIALVISGIALILTFLRWHLLVRAQDLEFSRTNAIRLGLIGYFFNTFLPGSVGGDVLKAIGIAREQSRRTLAVATVLIDRAIGLWALVWFVALLGGYFYLVQEPILLENPYLQNLVLWSAYIVIGSVVGWIVLSFLPDRRARRFAHRLESIPKVGRSLAEVWRAVWIYQQRRKAVIAAILISLVGHAGWVLVFHLSTQIFEMPNASVTNGTLAEHLLVVPVGMTLQAIFPSPGGVGGGEAAYGWLYTLLNKPRVNGILGCLAQRFLYWILAIIGYFVYLRMTAHRHRAKAHPEPESGEIKSFNHKIAVATQT